MTTLVPRGPYTDEELRKLYPANLRVELVQIVGRIDWRFNPCLVCPRIQGLREDRLQQVLTLTFDITR